MSKEFNYMLLSRLQSDNEYFLGNGNGYEPQLWAKSLDAQIKKMNELYDSFPEDEKPEWITKQDIKNYEIKMKELLNKKSRF
jgi:hypothetical protein